jgi:hypothetical protein
MQEQLLDVFRRANASGDKDRPYLAECIEILDQNKKVQFLADDLIAEIQARCARNAGSHPIAQQQSHKSAIFLGNRQAVLKMAERHREVIAAIQDRIQRDVELALQNLGLSSSAAPAEADDDGDDFFIEAAPTALITRHKYSLHASFHQ